MGKAARPRTDPRLKMKNLIVFTAWLLGFSCLCPLCSRLFCSCFTKLQDIYGNLYKEDTKCKHWESSSSDLTCNNIEKWGRWTNQTRLSRPCCSTSPHSANRQTSSDKVRNYTKLGQNIKANVVDLFPLPFHVAFCISFLAESRHLLQSYEGKGYTSLAGARQV